MGPININTDGMWILMMIGAWAVGIMSVVAFVAIMYIFYRGFMVICCGQ